MGGELFYGRQICQVGSVGWVFFFFFFSGSKNEPKITKNSKKSNIFAEKFWENILSYFQNYLAKIFRFWSNNSWFYKILEKLKKKKSVKMENLGQSRL